MYEAIKNDKLQVLMFNYEFPPLGGGSGNAKYYLLKEFSQYPEIEIDLVTSSTSSFKVEAFSDNISIHYLDINKRNKNLHYQTNQEIINYFLRAYSYAKKLQKQKRFDLSHAFFGIPCGYIALLLGLPYIVSLRGSDVPFFNKRFYWLDRLVFKRLSKRIWKSAVVAVANSNGLKELAQKAAPDQEIAVIYNGVDLDQFYPLENKAMSNKLKLISTGRLIERKGYAYLIEALRDTSEVELTLIGEGDLYEMLNNLAQKYNVPVKFLGRVNHEDIAKHLRTADVFVQPSLNEGMSNSVLEAMACGLPIIATDTGGSSELVKGNGFIVEEKNSKELKEAINKYLEDQTLISKHGKKSRHLAAKMSWSRAAKEYLGLYSICK